MKTIFAILIPLILFNNASIFAASTYAFTSKETYENITDTAIILDPVRSLFLLIGGKDAYNARPPIIDISVELQKSLTRNTSFYFNAESFLNCSCLYGITTGLYYMPEGNYLSGWFVRSGVLFYHVYFPPTAVPADAILGAGETSYFTTIGVEITGGYQFLMASGILISFGIGVRGGYDSDIGLLFWPGIELFRVGYAW